MDSQSYAAQGEAAAIAFEGIYIQHAPQLRAIAIRKFNVPDADVDTLVHDVFASFLISAPNVRNLEPYLVGAICNASRKYWQKQKQRDSFFAPLDETSASAADVQHSVAETLLLNDALSRIDDRCRNVIERYYLDQEPASAIAEAIGTTAGNVSYLLHICRKRLRAMFHQLSGCAR
jgi:RNA polymerase sigma factor (sigma-70 family)